ncbi:TPA: metal-sensitive transcriptional regulator [Candidatus Poribacteria bacterium]|nr:metal-sensitive transcriptional regulator [Candidatus Poribacteria bacterium]
MIDEKTKREALRRLRRIEGQVRGITRMVEEERYCVDILTQISAARAALQSLAAVVLKRHIESCVAEAMTSGSEMERVEKIDELVEVFFKFSDV